MTAPSRKSGWIATALAAASVIAVGAVIAGLWSDIGGAEMSPAGWAAMVLGIVLTLALGIGLMTLVFISSRRGYDEPGDDRR